MSVSNVFVLFHYLLWKTKLELTALGEGLDSWSINVSFSTGSIASCGVMKTPFCIIQAYRVFCLVWCPCMAINVIIQYNGGYLANISMLTQAPIFVWFDDTIIVYYYYCFCTLLTMFTTLSSVLLCLVALHDD